MNMGIVVLASFRYLLMAPLALVWTILCSWAIIAISLAQMGKPKEHLVVYYWSRVLLAFFNIRLTVTGEENLSGGGVGLFNHTSFFDVVAICASSKRILRFGAKEVLMRIPIFGAAARHLGMLPIARDNRAAAIRIYEQAKQQLKNGETVLLAPEGTRMATDKLGPFKSGPFIFAIQTHFPIIPVIVKGAREVMPKNSPFINCTRWQAEISVCYLPVISSTEFTIESREQLKAKVRAVMLKELKQLED